jgi:hypothetical protein
MQQQRWEKIELILDEALSKKTIQKQENYIETHYEDDPQLLREVRLLLRAIYEAEQKNYLNE